MRRGEESVLELGVGGEARTSTRTPPTNSLEEPSPPTGTSGGEPPAVLASGEERGGGARAASRGVRRARAWLFAALLITLFVALLASVSSSSGIVYALLGFTPTILATIIFMGLVEGNYKEAVFALTPLGLAFLFARFLSFLL